MIQWRNDDDPAGPLEAAERAQHMAEMREFLLPQVDSISIMPGGVGLTSDNHIFVNIHDQDVADQYRAMGITTSSLPCNSGGPAGKPYLWEAKLPDRYLGLCYELIAESGRKITGRRPLPTPA